MSDFVIPIKKLRVKANSKPWFDSEKISTIQKRDKLYSRYKKSGLETDTDKFKISKIFKKKATRKIMLLY